MPIRQDPKQCVEQREKRWIKEARASMNSEISPEAPIKTLQIAGRASHPLRDHRDSRFSDRLSGYAADSAIIRIAARNEFSDAAP